MLRTIILIALLVSAAFGEGGKPRLLVTPTEGIDTAFGRVGVKYDYLDSFNLPSPKMPRTEFLQHYHKRGNAESTFSMMKRKFGDGLRSKTDVAMVNETLCKILCHNLVVLIHEMCELGIEPMFWPSNLTT